MNETSEATMEEVCGGRLIEHDHPATPMMFGALVMWAFENQECCEAFSRDTGYTFAGPRSPLDAMIDDATGLDAERAKAFVRWCAETMWGMEGESDAEGQA